MFIDLKKRASPGAGPHRRISSLSKREARSPSGNTVSGLGGHVEGKKFARCSSKRGEVVAGAAVKSTAKRKTGVGSRRRARRAVFSEGSNRTVIEEKEKERGKKKRGREGWKSKNKGQGKSLLWRGRTSSYLYTQRLPRPTWIYLSSFSFFLSPLLLVLTLLIGRVFHRPR